MKKIRIGTRGSALALKQTELIKEQLKNLECEIVVIQTKGDAILDKPLHKIGDKGLFTAELEEALRKEEIDLAVHSLKDLPTKIAEDLPIMAITQREDPWDCFVFADKFKNLKSYKELPKGSMIGTSSLRRIVQLKSLRPDFRFLNLRGNINTRLKKIKDAEQELAAGILALAGLKRIGLQNQISEILKAPHFLPAPGQGALALQINLQTFHNNKNFAEILLNLNHQQTYIITSAERAALQSVDGGCQTPFGAYGEIIDNKLKLQGVIGNIECSALYRAEEVGEISEFREIGKRLGEKLKIVG